MPWSKNFCASGFEVAIGWRCDADARRAASPASSAGRMPGHVRRAGSREGGRERSSRRAPTRASSIESTPLASRILSRSVRPSEACEEDLRRGSEPSIIEAVPGAPESGGVVFVAPLARLVDGRRLGGLHRMASPRAAARPARDDPAVGAPRSRRPGGAPRPTPRRRRRPRRRPRPEPVKVTSVEGITEYRLANGLRVLLFPDPTKPTITVNITYLVGSRHEGYGETGMAHLLEHLLFKGTPKPPEHPAGADRARRAAERLDLVRPHQLLRDASRPPTRTCSWALDLEADRMVNSFIAKKDLDSEMTVVRNEFETGENDPAVDPRGARPLDRVPLAQLRQVHDRRASPTSRTCRSTGCRRSTGRYYQPDNAVLLVAGQVRRGEDARARQRDLRRDPEARRARCRRSTRVEPTQDGERSVTLRRVGDVQALAAAYHVPPGRDPDSARDRHPAAQVLADTPSGRLYKALVETKKATRIGGYFMQLHDPGLSCSFGAEVRQDQSLDDAQDARCSQTLDDAARTPPITTEEVERARATHAQEHRARRSTTPSASACSSREWIGQGDWRLFFLHRDRHAHGHASRTCSARRAAYLKPSNRTRRRVRPDRQARPRRDPAAARRRRAASRTTRATRRSRPARRSTRRPRTSRRARSARRCRTA